MNTLQHLLTWQDYNADEIGKVLSLAQKIRADPASYAESLRGRQLTMLFQKTSTRTRFSYAAAMTQLGGNTLDVDWQHTNYGLTDIANETKALSQFTDVIMARLLLHSDLQVMAKVATKPVINGCCEKYHPSQVLGDMLTLIEQWGDVAGKHLVFIGVWNNMCNSLITIGLLLGMRVTVVCPLQPEASQDIALRAWAEDQPNFIATTDVAAALSTADVVYTDTWVDMEHFNDPTFVEEKQKCLELMLPYQLNAELLAGSSALVMHDMPIHVDYEITQEVVDSPQSIIIAQESNRLHAQKALLLHLLTS